MFCRCCEAVETRPQPEVVAHQTLISEDREDLQLPQAILKQGLSPVQEEPGQETPASCSPGKGRGDWERFMVRLHYTPGSKLGLMLDISDAECCLVKDITPEGLLAKCMTSAGKAAAQWMRLLAVNGMRGGSQDLVRKVEEIYCLDGMLELTFEQPRRFSLDLSKHRNKDLGMELRAQRTSVGISTITGGGIVADYNASVPEDRRIGLSSRVIAVDGSNAGGGEQMLQTIMSDQAFSLTVLNWSTERAG